MRQEGCYSSLLLQSAVTSLQLLMLTRQLFTDVICDPLRVFISPSSLASTSLSVCLSFSPSTYPSVFCASSLLWSTFCAVYLQVNLCPFFISSSNKSTSAFCATINLLMLIIHKQPSHRYKALDNTVNMTCWESYTLLRKIKSKQ